MKTIKDMIRNYNDKNNAYSAIRNSKLSTTNKIYVTACMVIGSYVISKKAYELGETLGEKYEDEIVGICSKTADATKTFIKRTQDTIVKSMGGNK